MGQRLNFQIISSKEDNKVLACGYYHWSGYTLESVEITEGVIEAIENMDPELFKTLYNKSKVLLAIKLLEIGTKAGLNPCNSGVDSDDEQIEDTSSLSVAKELFPDYADTFLPFVDRIVGIIDITDVGIALTQRWQEALVELDIDTMTIMFDAVCIIDDVDEYREIYGDDIPLPKTKIDLSNCGYGDAMTFEQFRIFSEIIRHLTDLGENCAAFDVKVFEEGDALEPKNVTKFFSLIS